MKLLSIDASTKSTGIAIFDKNKLIHYECIHAENNNKIKRIKKMTKKISELIKKYNPSDIVMQDILPEDVKHNQNVFKALIYLQAAIVLAADQYQKNIIFYTASHWRSLVGIKLGQGRKRKQLKEAAMRLVEGIYNIKVNDDISDAICLGIAYIKEHQSAF